MKTLFAQLQVAVMMLTRLPAGKLSGEVPTVASSAWAFPLVGGVLGSMLAISFVLGQLIGLSQMLAALVVVTLGAVLTGALHEDGLADTADGFGGGQDKVRKLEIMRDSRIGTYGVVALVLALSMRVVAISEVANPVWGLVAMTAFSRATVPLLMWRLPPAREDGLGRSAGLVPRKTALIAVAAGAVFLIPLGPLALAVGAGMLAAALGLGSLARRQIGGQTGDVLGAGQQVAEISGWLILAAFV